MAKVDVFLPVVVFMKVNGLMIPNMVMDNIFGITARFTKVNGDRIREMVTVNALLLMVMFTKEIGLMVKCMVMDYINGITGIIT